MNKKNEIEKINRTYSTIGWYDRPVLTYFFLPLIKSFITFRFTFYFESLKIRF